jgi:pterin-4a-carbinolamine dehydratase
MLINKIMSFSLIYLTSFFLLLSITLISTLINIPVLGIKSNSDLLFSPNFIPYGSKYESWIAKWVQWSYSISSQNHPAYDYTGKICSQKQSEPVWFLVGTFGYPVIRECTIPLGTAILFPVLNIVCSYAEYPNFTTKEQLKECTSRIQNQTTDINVYIDRIKLVDINKYRIQSSLFNLTLPQDNVINVNPQVTQAISEGYWIFLKPLNIGKHEIKFTGNVNFENNTYSFSQPNGWNYETIYNLTIISEQPLTSIKTTINYTDIKDYLNQIRQPAGRAPDYRELKDSEIKVHLNQLPAWNVKDNKLYKTFKFNDFANMFSFAFKVAELSQSLDHHPNMTTGWDTIKIVIYTWNIENISDYDIKLARDIEEIYQKTFNNLLS